MASRFTLDRLEHPIVQAPMAGGPSTAALAVAVSEAGGLGFLAAGYKAPEAVRADIEDVQARSGRPFGINVFVPTPQPADPGAVTRYGARLRTDAQRYGASLGDPRFDDDAFEAKLTLVCDAAVPVVSFAFGCPAASAIEALQRAGAAVWVTVTTPQEALAAAAAGADALVVQGVEAGGHRGSFDDGAPGDIGLLALLQLVSAAVELPMVATGGIATGRGVAAVLAAGAVAAQLGTAFLLTPEAGTALAHRRALEAGADPGPTALTRAFSGRTARGIVNRFQREHSAEAPSAYPEVHHLTTPLRAAARAAGDPDGINLWAGQAYPLAAELGAGDVLRRLASDARAALAEAARTLI